MSYSNNWEIEEIAGLTSLKDCYRVVENGVSTSILQYVGCPRLGFEKNTSIRVNDTQQPVSSYTDSKFYVIPDYFINDTSFGAFGHTNYENHQRQDANYNYTNNITYKTGKNYKQAIKWHYDYYPLIIYDNLQDYTSWKRYSLGLDDVCYIEETEPDDNGHIVIKKKKFILPDNLWSLYSIEETTLTVRDTETNVWTQSYVAQDASNINHLYWNTTEKKWEVKGTTLGSSYGKSGLFVRYEHLFRTCSSQLVPVRRRGHMVIDDVNYTDWPWWQDQLFSFVGWSINSISENGNVEKLDPDAILTINNSSHNGVQVNRESNMCLLDEWDMIISPYESKRIGRTCSYFFNEQSDLITYIKRKYCEPIYSTWYHDNDLNSSVVVMQGLYLIAPSYQWYKKDEKDADKYRYPSDEFVSFSIGQSLSESTPQIRKNISFYETPNIRQSLHDNIISGEKHTYGAAYNNSKIYHNPNNGPVSFNSSTTNRSCSMVRGVYVFSEDAPLRVNFPLYQLAYDPSIWPILPDNYVYYGLRIRPSDFIKDGKLNTYVENTAYGITFTKRLSWTGNYFYNNNANEVDIVHGIHESLNLDEDFLYIRANESDYMLDFSVQIQGDLEQGRVGLCAFVKEPIWFEIEDSDYYIKHDYTNIEDEFPITINMTFYVWDTPYDVVINWTGEGIEHYSINEDYTLSLYNLKSSGRFILKCYYLDTYIGFDNDNNYVSAIRPKAENNTQ